MSKPNSSQKGLIPHPPNVTAVAAASLFAGALLNSRVLAILLPLGMLFFSDFVINNTVSRSFFPEVTGMVVWQSYMTWVYVGFGLTVLIGSAMLKKRSAKRKVGAAVAATLVFWILSNIGILVTPGGYPETLAGAAACFTAAIPFLINSFIGNLIFTFVIFGIYDFVNDRYTKPQQSIA